MLFFLEFTKKGNANDICVPNYVIIHILPFLSGLDEEQKELNFKEQLLKLTVKCETRKVHLLKSRMRCANAILPSI